MKRILPCVALFFLALSAQAQIQIELKFKRLQYIAYEPVIATIKITNLAGRDIELHDADDQHWFGFEVTGNDGRTLGPLAQVPEPPLQMAAGTSVTRKIDLTKRFPVADLGVYHVRPNVYFADLNKYFYAQAKVFEVTTARPIWQKTVGLPSADGERTYSLMTNRFSDHASLYARVEDKANGLVYSTYSLGRLISFDEPHAEIDRENQLHVLQCSAPRMWSYSVIGLDGRLLKHLSYAETRSTPRLRRMADGSVTVAGGLLDVPVVPGTTGKPSRNYPSGRWTYLRTIKAMPRSLCSALRRALSLGWVGVALSAGAILPAQAVSAASSPHTIVIDPGHGGFDLGGIPGQRVAEKTMALDVAQRVGRKLRAAGYRVIMTRDTDVFVPLGTRVAIANAQRDAEFVCIHFNSATRSGANGIETYYYRSDSARLAANIHRQVVSGTVTENRGIRRRGFFVLRRTSIPSVLVECGFLTNPGEAGLALQTSYRERLADKIAAGVEGKPAPYTRPVVAGLTHVTSPIGGSVNDFVAATAERPSISHHSSRRGLKKSSRSSSTKSSKSSKKKSTKKSSSSKRRRKRSLPTTISLTTTLHSPIITPEEMRAAEERAFAVGVTAEALMEEAGEGIARALTKFFPEPGRCLVFAGKGHNAGDAFVAARRLAALGWSIETRLAYPAKKLSKLTGKKLRELRAAQPPAASSGGLTIILDGLLGLGAKPPLREPIRASCREINAWRPRARIIAIDLPTGLDGESGEADPDCVRADLTITIGFAKAGLVADDALDFVGRLEVIPLAALATGSGAAEVAIPETLGALLPRRNYSAYKNQFGRIGIVAGSRGFTGAALLCSLGALRAGGGLVELFVLEDIYEIIATAAAPEVMVKPVKSYADLLEEPIDVWAVGPGLGKARANEILALIRAAEQPMVVDADGLNIVAQKIETLKKVRGPRLLTPHPGEMKRLFPVKKKSRADWAAKFCRTYDVALLLKGSRTIVAGRGRPLSYNTTGTPGMATGGMGDVLTGVCAGLLGAKLSPNDAARVGAWACGRAAELALSSGHASEESLLPTDVLAHLGPALRELHRA